MGLMQEVSLLHEIISSRETSISKSSQLYLEGTIDSSEYFYLELLVILKYCN